MTGEMIKLRHWVDEEPNIRFATFTSSGWALYHDYRAFDDALPIAEGEFLSDVLAKVGANNTDPYP